MIWKILLGTVIAALLFRIGRVFYRAFKSSWDEVVENPSIYSFGDKDVEVALDAFKPEPKILALMAAANPEDHAARAFYCRAIQEDVDLDTMKGLLKKNPEDADTQLLYAIALMERGFAARTTERADDVSDEQWETCYRYLKQAREAFQKAADMRPADPTPWAYQIMLGTPYEDDQETYFKWFNEAVQRDPENWLAHNCMINALSEKWGGSHDAMFSFAREVANKAPDGSDIPVILLSAFACYLHYLHMFDEDAAAGDRFCANADIHAEGLAAWNKSLGHPNHQPCKTSVFAYYCASAWFWNSKQRAPLKTALAAIEEHVQDAHWRPFFAFDLAAAKALSAEENPYIE